MAEFWWAEERDRLTGAFGGELLRAQTEQDLLVEFERAPRAFLEEADRVAQEKRSGGVRSAWATLLYRLRQRPQSNLVVVADDGEARQKRIVMARRYVVNALLHHPSETEVEDDLFGRNGLLREYAADQALLEELLELWRQERPRAELAEREADARGAEFRARKTRLHLVEASA